MAKFIVHTGPEKEVHRTTYTVSACKISEISSKNRIDTDEEYTVKYPNLYDGSGHCYKEKHRK